MVLIVGDSLLNAGDLKPAYQQAGSLLYLMHG
jgi:hypothetical protein